MEIWSIAGGKGGTGKSFLSSIIGVILADKGYSVTLVDGDFGGSNLHSYFGIKRPKKSLKNFFDDGEDLESLAIETKIHNLKLIPGTFNSNQGESIKYFQKLKFHRHLRKIESDFVILDLGAGATNNTIDSFLAADKKIAVVLSDKMAIENFYFFIKNTFFRQFSSVLAQLDCKEKGIEFWQNKKKYNINSLRDYILKLRTISSDVEEAIDKELTNFKLNIVLNQIRDFSETETGLAVKSMLLKFMGISANYLGAIRYDRSLWSRLKYRDEYINKDSASRLIPEVEGIVSKLLSGDKIWKMR